MNRLALGAGLLTHKRWNRTNNKGVPLYKSSAMAVMPGLEHAFTTRIGGCSDRPYGTLNLGSHVGDEPGNVDENRGRVVGALGFELDDVVTAEQVHGNVPVFVTRTGSVSGADALVTNAPNLLLMLMFADCVPVYIFDPINRAIGLVHSGWKGAALNVVQATVQLMTESFGSRPENCLAAVGPCIGFDRYEVSLDVAAQFRNSAIGRDSGSAQIVVPFNEMTGTYLLNLRQVVFQQLTCAGFRIESIAVSDQCTYSNSKDFFSHRRDGAGGARTGRMAGVIGLRPLTRSRGNS